MGYGSKDNPVPWQGPQARITEVHWISGKHISVVVPITCDNRSIEFPGGGSCVATHEIGSKIVISGWVGGGVIYYTRRTPEPEFTNDGPYDEAIGSGIRPSQEWYDQLLPKINEGRTTGGKGDVDINDTDPIRSDEVTFEGMPTLNLMEEVGAWIWYSGVTWHPEEPTGPYTEYKVQQAESGGNYKRFRQGADFVIKGYGSSYIGPPLCYGALVGEPTGSTAAQAPSLLPVHDTPFQKTIDFAGATFTYKNKTYKPIGRYVAGPYTLAELNSMLHGQPRSFSLVLLCQVQKD